MPQSCPSEDDRGADPGRPGRLDRPPLSQSLLLRALIDELARCGLRDAVTAPGSRNTPIVSALVRDSRLRCWSHVDERSAGFFAVGAARASGLPVVVTVTSGTAVANLHPAVIEAHEAGLGLIVLSADRPAELREVGAGQTIDQVKIFGTAAKWYFELDVAEASAERMRWVRSLACRAWMAATDGRPGVVHLNIPLREPLVHDAELGADPPGGGGRDGGLPWTSGTETFEPVRSVPAAPAGRALIVAGEIPSAVTAASLSRFAESHGLPLLADPLSGARRGAAAVAHYDLILRDPATAERLVPEQIWRIGGLPTSKPLRRWLAGLRDVPQAHLHTRGAWIDPDGTVGLRASAGGALFREPESAAPADWLAAWQAADATVAASVAGTLGEALSEPRVAQLLGAELPSEATLFVAASMPIRDVEEFFGVRADSPRVLANRGANGIDGTVSSALGVAAVSDGPVVLLIGDVALAHDIGGLLAAGRAGLGLTIVLINNDGGGIFNFLPIAGQLDVFSEHVATPHGLDFAHAAALYGFAHVRPDGITAFRAALGAATASAVATIIEVRTDRVQNRALHRDVETAALTALTAR